MTLYRAHRGEVTGAADVAEKAFAGIYGAVREARYDLVHNHAFDAPAVSLATSLCAAVVHTLHLPPDVAMANALQHAVQRDPPPTVAAVSASQASAWRQVIPLDMILPPYVPTRLIGWSPTEGNGAVFAGRLSPEKGVAEAIDIAHAAGVGIDVYGDSYDAEYAQQEIYPRRADLDVSVRPSVPELSSGR